MQSTSRKIDYTCIIPWSGGVESTALVCHALDMGEAPFLFHLTFNGYWQNQIDAVTKMSEEIGIPLHFIHQKSTTPYADAARTAKHYSYGYAPMYINWANYAQMIHFQNPFIPKIWYGFNASTDVKTPAVLELFDSIERVATLQGNPVIMESPLGHLTKREQYDMIWDELKPFITTCTDIENPPCGKCSKCKELEIVK